MTALTLAFKRALTKKDKMAVPADHLIINSSPDCLLKCTRQVVFGKLERNIFHFYSDSFTIVFFPHESYTFFVMSSSMFFSFEFDVLEEISAI